jgi:HD-GYP domain-containing protein (c-di-GMP phosphodiesterase class II)
MQRVSVPYLLPGMVVAASLFRSDGQLLISAGTTLTSAKVARLRHLGVGSVYVSNPLFENLAVPELVREDTRVKLMQSLQHTFQEFQKTQELDIEHLRSLVKILVSEIILNRDAMVHTLDMRSYGEYLFGHSVNVAILSVLTAVCMEYNEARLNDLAMGALLHDLGMMLVSKQILTKVGQLTTEEVQVVKQHTEAGFQIVRKKREITTPAAHIAFQHHERFDGQGYPRRLKGQEIHEYSRIAAVADIFDALTSDRPFRQGLLPHEAYEILMTLADTYVDREILDIFLANVAIYPVGTVVKLNSGETAVVTRVLPKLQSRPLLRVLADKSGKLLKKPVEVDLTEHLTAFVTKVFREAEVFALSKAL